MLVVAAECLCRYFGWGADNPRIDPFAGFSGEMVPLFTIDPLSNEYVTASNRLKFFAPDGFKRKKAERAFRIFCLGGSTVQGRPYAIETSFTTWLRLSLQAAFPDREFEVVNCGGVSYASYRLIPILDECLNYEPDLFIVGTGHNECLEDRTYARVRRHAKHFGGVYRWVSKLRLFRIGQGVVQRDSERDKAPRTILKAEVDALLDYRGGLEGYERDDAWRDGVIAHFANNIQRLIGLSKQAGTPLIMLNLPANLKDTPPFKSQSLASLTADQSRQWRALTKQADAHFQTNLPEAVRLLKAANAIDPRYAGHHYALGQCLLALGRPREAKTSFQRALEEDVCSLRMLGAMRVALRDSCLATQMPLVDLDALLAGECSQKIAGNEILVDHVHPSIRGHQLAAAELHRVVAERFAFGAPKAGWQERRDAAFAAHLEALPPLYFAHGQRRLDNLRAWTEGRADGPPLPPMSERTKKTLALPLDLHQAKNAGFSPP